MANVLSALPVVGSVLGAFGVGSKKVSPPPPPPAPPAPPTREDAAQSLAKEEAERKKKIAASGRKTTIFTSGRGDLSSAPVNRKTLLGE